MAGVDVPVRFIVDDKTLQTALKDTAAGLKRVDSLTKDLKDEQKRLGQSTDKLTAASKKNLRVQLQHEEAFNGLPKSIRKNVQSYLTLIDSYEQQIKLLNQYDKELGKASKEYTDTARAAERYSDRASKVAR